eukprot:scaffold8001_cov92-Skeletonema_dohrnii-CCMP3373.AAC.3
MNEKWDTCGARRSKSMEEPSPVRGRIWKSPLACHALHPPPASITTGANRDRGGRTKHSKYTYS